MKSEILTSFQKFPSCPKRSVAEVLNAGLDYLVLNVL